jgi:hypothetical protein
MKFEFWFLTSSTNNTMFTGLLKYGGDYLLAGIKKISEPK